ncbi:hypothetical protein [Streptomyces sp. SAJ15]|uniref:hypothetical protein n=1 Tax=Streptomyces sp. SAJ15 TaxID=2011095 RepID=UPI001184B5E6|nr:hypothetical protein [Streptomyces sp. SAJ15]TVL88445.1 hypothetical protein CD790_30800 [Streptomyces sp. SAJ15]
MPGAVSVTFLLDSALGDAPAVVVPSGLLPVLRTAPSEEPANEVERLLGAVPVRVGRLEMTAEEIWVESLLLEVSGEGSHEKRVVREESVRE